MSSGIFSNGLFSIYANNANSKYKILALVEKIAVIDLCKEKIVELLKSEKIDVDVSINEIKEENFFQYHIAEKLAICESCRKRSVLWSKYCGANVCDSCNQHQGLAKCYCGWNLQAGEKLHDDIGTSVYQGNGNWEVDY